MNLPLLYNRSTSIHNIHCRQKEFMKKWLEKNENNKNTAPVRKKLNMSVGTVIICCMATVV